jgi:hypothetical protein
MLYSTLEEAYNIPSVKPKKKLKDSCKNKCSGESDYYTSNYKINLCNNNEKKVETNEVSGNEVPGVKEEFNNYKASNQCETLQAPAYRYPLINDDDKEKVNKVLEKRGGDDINFDNNMDDIKSYVEDDLDMYFEYEIDEKKENKITNEVQEKVANKVQEMKEEDGRLIIRPKKNKKKNIEITEKWMDKLMELLLLLLLGIFIILLLEILINVK